MVTKIISIQANGTIKNTVDLPTGFDYFISRWVIDPQGRWNASVRPMSMGGQQSPTPPAVEFIRLLPDGTFDTSFGTNGIKAMPSLPSAVTVNGTSVNMNYSISGFAATATGILFTGFALAFSGNPSCGSPPYANSSMTYYPYYVSSDTGLLTSYGNNGLGEPVSIEILGADRCSPGGAVRTSYINSSGAHALFAQTRAIGAQAAGLTSATWLKADGVTSGGEGVGVAGVQGRTDNKVYSRKLPTRTQVETSLNVLTKKASRTQMLRTRTPKVCVALTQSVVLVKTGRCRIDIVNRASRRTVRSLSTWVSSKESAVGTTVTPNDPIRFAQVSRRLSRTARTQIAELAETASEARRVIIVGHSAGLTENRISNNRIALQRAAAVKAALRAEFKKAGVKVPISIVSVGPNAPLTTKKSNSAQARNRRVEVFILQ
jgi:outer membrane protein OmpA-like peptidoglycan-associated protein